MLFPEGGFLRKRRETSQLFAKKHSLPHLTHVTLPRLGATHVILKTLSAQQENGIVGDKSGMPIQTGNIHAQMFFFNMQIFEALLDFRLFPSCTVSTSDKVINVIKMLLSRVPSRIYVAKRL